MARDPICPVCATRHPTHPKYATGGYVSGPTPVIIGPGDFPLIRPGQVVEGNYNYNYTIPHASFTASSGATIHA